jgi:hypothetical protein
MTPFPHIKRIFIPFFLVLIFIAALGSVHAATIVVPAGGDLQAAISAATFGDTIVLQAGATYTRATGFVLPNKGTGTGTDADYITIQTSNLAGIAAPNSRINPTAHVAAMPRLISTGGYAVVSTVTGAHHYKLIGLEITTNGDPNKYTPDLVDIGPNIDKPTRQQVLSMKGFVIDRCFIHTAEIDATNLFASTLNRTSGRGIGISGVDVWVTNSYIAGFAGMFPTVHPEAGHAIDSYGVYSVTGPGPLHILNNYIEAQFNNVFLGGGDPNTPNTATISNPTMSSATFSNVANLQVGDLVALASTGASPKPWQSGRVTAINGSNVSFTLLHPSNSSPLQVPDNGGLARWRGDTISDVEIRGNFLNKPDAWNAFSNPKSWIEIKIGDRIMMDGNEMYSGVGTTLAFTVRNQDGSAPWSTISNLTFTNNRVRGYKWAFGIQASDNEQVSGAVSNFNLSNNLFYKQLPVSGSQPLFLQMISGVTSGARDITVKHNTILQTGALWLVDGWPVNNFVFKDNITGSGGYGPQCYVGSGGIQDCWPSVVSDHNVIWDNRYSPGSTNMIPGVNFYQINSSAIGFSNLAGDT